MNDNFPASINLAELDGTNGFKINSGFSVVSNAGDINGDGVDDIIIGSPGANPIDNSSTGESYVIFGGSSVGNTGIIDPSALDGNNGFILRGVDPGDSSGESVSNAGDINGDGFDDLIIGAPGAYPNGFVFPGGEIGSGASYVVFGGGDVGGTGLLELSELNGNNGFVINGIDAFDQSGQSVSNAGDINGDGIEDLIIGASSASSYETNGSTYVGESYVVFGQTGIGASGSLELSDLNGNNGFLIQGIEENSLGLLGFSVSNAGDVNGDGIDDLIIGAPVADPDGNQGAGESYVVFGQTDIGSSGSLELVDLNGSNGFIIQGLEEGDNLGRSVSNAGDVNGDGVDDLIIGATFADANGNQNAGETYVVFGQTNIGSSGSLKPSSSNGFVIRGLEEGDNVGRSVSNAGDINGDGIDDLIIGASGVELNGNQSTGVSYVVFGDVNLGSNGSIDLSSLNGTNGFAIEGINEYDFSGRSLSNAGDINGDGIDDLMIGSSEGSYVVFGKVTATNTIVGTPGNDTLKGSGDRDSIFGLAGDDRLRGLAGDDSIEGDGGNDSISGNNGNDLLVGGDGNDILRGDRDNDILDGGVGNDTLFGGVGADSFVIKAGEGNDLIFDYWDGTDKFVLGAGLEFDDLDIVQNISNTEIRLIATDEVLATLNSVTANFLNADDFITED